MVVCLKDLLYFDSFIDDLDHETDAQQVEWVSADVLMHFGFREPLNRTFGTLSNPFIIDPHSPELMSIAKLILFNDLLQYSYSLLNLAIKDVFVAPVGSLLKLGNLLFPKFIFLARVDLWKGLVRLKLVFLPIRLFLLGIGLPFLLFGDDSIQTHGAFAV